MPLPTEDRHFRAFRTSGDPNDLARVFDATATRLLRVGVHLTRDLHAAEDLVQTTFVTAIERAADHRDDAPVLAWLLGILANRARYQRRQSSRRVDPVRIAERTTAEPPDLATERELEDQLTAALDDLPTLYSQVLELHLCHGLGANQIARVLRRPAGTVRTQICRGLDLLRRALPTGLAVGGAMTLTAGHGLAMVREHVLRRAASQFAIGTSTIASIASVGGFVVMKKTLICVAVAATAMLGWYSFSSPPAIAVTPNEPSVAADAKGQISEQQEARTRPDPDTEASPEILTRQPVITGTAGDVRIRCVWASDAVAVPAIDVVRYRVEPTGNTGPLEILPSGANGEVTFTALPIGTHLFRAARGRVSVTVEPDRIVEADLEINEFAVVTGSVVDESARPIEGAMIDAAAGSHLPQTVATTAKDGTFRLRLANQGEIWARKADWQPSPLYRITGTTDGVVLTLASGGQPVTGVVLDPRGRPVTGAVVAVAIDAAENQIDPQKPPIVVRTNEHGRFETREVPPGAHTVYALAEGYAFGEAAVEVETGTVAAEVTIQLRAGGTIHGVALDGEGRDRPVAGLSMLVMRERELPGMRAGLSDLLVRKRTTTDSNGRYRFTAVASGRMWVIALVGNPKKTNIVLEDGQDLEWNPDLSPPGSKSIRGVLEGPDGAKLADWRVQTSYINLVTRTPESSRATTDAEGNFELGNLRDMPYDVSAFPPDAPALVFAVRQGVHPGPGSIVWRLDSLPADNGAIAGRVLGPDGQPLDGASLGARRAGVSRRTAVAPGTGAFHIEELPPGAWSVSGHMKGYGSFALGDHTVAARATLDIGEHQLEALGCAVVRVRMGNSPATNLSLRLEQEDGATNNTSKFEPQNGAMRSSAIPPGRYRLSVCGADIAPIERTVLIAPGVDTAIDLDAERAVTVAIEFVPEDLESQAWQDTVSLELTEPSGRKVIARTVAASGGRSHMFRVGLLPGAYTIAGTSDADVPRRGSETFVVPAAGAERSEPIAVRVALAVQKQ